MHRFRVVMAVVLLLALATPAAVSAGEGYDAHIFKPSLFGGRYLTFEDAQTMPQFSWALGAIIGYANAPVEVRDDNDRVTGVLDSMLSLDLMGGFSLHEMINVGAGLPLHLYNRGRSFDDLGNATGASQRENNVSLGDARIAAKVRILEEGIWPMGLAVTPFFTLPTGDASRLLGEDRFTAGLSAIYEINLAWLRMAINGGYHYRGRSGALGTQVRNGYPLGVGFSRDIIDPLNLSLELHGEAYESDNNRRFAGNPLELDLVARYTLFRDFRLLAGGGPGITSGVGSPDFRLFAGVIYKPDKLATPPPSTGDLRVVVQDENGNRLEAEVGLEGPELRIGNTTNGSFAQGELSPGNYVVRASRPDFETGVTEANVQAGRVATVTVVMRPLETKLTVVVLDHDSGQRLPGAVIFYPGQPGESIVDNPSGELTMVFSAGPVTLTATAPDHESVMTSAIVEANKITTLTIRLRRMIAKKGRIFFDLDSATLRPESFDVLDDVARKINEIKPKRVIVEGHCSSEGTDEYNMKLSRERAETVRDYLALRGVAKAILVVQPFGESRPIATNETEEGRERNRRVEFILVEE